MLQELQSQLDDWDSHVLHVSETGELWVRSVSNSSGSGLKDYMERQLREVSNFASGHWPPVSRDAAHGWFKRKVSELSTWASCAS